jgi:PncC family amidohydrolase
MTEALEIRIGQALRRRQWTLALAESCTGGLVSHRVTNVPGSSDYYRGGIVSYANEAKVDLLDVCPETLAAQGAVSRETALEMAAGVRQALATDVGLSVTGIAGPGGGTPDKPVGLTWIAVSTPEGQAAERQVWSGEREAVKAQSAEAALALLLRVLEGGL